MAISYEPTTSCNLRCPECPSGLRQFTRPTGMLEQETFQRSIDELAPWLTYLTFYFQGFVTDAVAPGPFSATPGLAVTIVGAP